MIFQYSDAFITVATIDFETIVLFYARLFGQAPINQIPNIYAEFQLPGLRLGIFKPTTDEPEFEPTKGGMSLCLEMKDLEEAIAHLTILGYPPPGEIHTASHGREIYAYDPGGNRLILHQFWTEEVIGNVPGQQSHKC